MQKQKRQHYQIEIHYPIVIKAIPNMLIILNNVIRSATRNKKEQRERKRKQNCYINNRDHSTSLEEVLAENIVFVFGDNIVIEHNAR